MITCKRMMLAGLGFLATLACNGLKVIPDETGEIRIIGLETYDVTNTKSTNTDGYLLFVINVSTGDTLIRSTVAEVIANPLKIAQGTYYVVACNRLHTSPVFDEPQYKGTLRVPVESYKVTPVSILCELYTPGVRIEFEPGILGSYPICNMQVSDQSGQLNYNDETQERWGYFNPGDITMSLTASGVPLGSMHYTINSKTLYTFKVGLSGIELDSNIGIGASSIEANTTATEVLVNWQRDSNGATATTPTNRSAPYTVAEARQLAEGLENIRVTGYIVGNYYRGNDFLRDNITSDANVLLADAPGVTDVSQCISIYAERAAVERVVGLKTNPTHLDKKVIVTGTTANYLGMLGLNPATEAVLVE